MTGADVLLRALHGIGRAIGAAFGRRGLRRAVCDVPIRPLADLVEGERAIVIAEVSGDAPLRAPLSGRACVYYCVTIEDVDGSGIHRALAEDEEATTFVVVDGDARAIVDPTDARVSTRFDFLSQSAAAFDASPAQRALLEAHELTRRDWFKTTSLTYREAVIAPGARIAIAGTPVREAVRRAHGEQGYRDGGDTWMRLASTRAAPLIITDDPGELR